MLSNLEYLEKMKGDKKAKTLFGVERRKMKALEIIAEELISLNHAITSVTYISTHGFGSIRIKE